MPLSLGILQTDHVREELRPEYGDYTDMFHRVFRAVDEDVVFIDYDVQVALPTSIECDAYVITGSRHSVYEELPWLPPLVTFLEQVLAAGKKVIGVCFGHQLMAHYFGGRVQAADQGWAVGVHRTRVLRTYPWMSVPMSAVSLLSSHKDQVTDLPPGAELYLSSDFCPLAGFTMGDQVITVQGHPEFQKDYSSALMQMRQEMLGKDVYRTGMQSLAEPTDEQNFARWLLSFVTDGETGA